MNESISKITFLGDDVNLVLSDNLAMVKAAYALAAETQAATVKIYTDARDDLTNAIEWMMEVRSNLGLHSFKLVQHTRDSLVKTSNL